MGVVTRDEGNVSAGQNTIVTPYNADLNTLYNELNGKLNADNLAAGAVTDEKMDITVRQSTSRNETGFGNFVYSGILGSTSVSLILTLTAGTAYVQGYRLAMAATDKTMSATKDNYIDLDRDGNFHVTPVTIAATAPSIFANSIRIGKAVTNATTITSYVDLATRTTSVSPPVSRVLGAEVVYLSATQISVLAGIVEISGTNYVNTTSTQVTVTGNVNWLTGSAAASTHVYVYALANSAGTFDVRLSSIAPNRTDTAGNANGTKRYLLNGGTYYRFLGACRLNASVLYEFMSISTPDMFESVFSNGYKFLVSTTATTWTAQSVAAYIPANAYQALVRTANVQNAGDAAFIRRTGSGFATGHMLGYGASGTAESGVNTAWIDTNTSQSFDFRKISGGNTMTIRIAGYKVQR